MSYEPNVLRLASQRLEAQRRAHEQQQAQRLRKAYADAPELERIDRELRLTMARLATLALRGGADPSADVAALRERNLELQRRRAALLDKLGLAADALDEAPLCPDCGDTGWRGTEMCHCLHDLCSREQIRALSSMLDLGNQSFDSFRMDYYGTQPWPGWDVSPRENMELVYEVCLNYAQKFGKFYFKNLFLSGAPGLGKTFLSACIARTVSEAGFSVVYDTAGSVFARFETHRYLNCDLLILDDLGCEMTTQFVQSALYTLINTRLTAGKHTVISSNLSMEDVSRRYTPQIASRLGGEYHVLSFFGEDIRALKKNPV